MASPITPCPQGPVRDILCKIFCQTKREGAAFKADPANAGKRFNYSGRAKELAQTTYAPALKRLGEFVPEKSFLVSVAKGALGDTARKVYDNARLRARLLREAAQQAGEKAAQGLAKKAAGRVALKFIPVVNVLSLLYDVYEIGSAGYEIYEKIDDYLKNYDTFQIRPDLAELGPDGEVKKIYDYKFDYPDGGTDTLGAEQRKLYRAKTGKEPVVISKDCCNC